MRLLTLVDTFPSLSETFIAREIDAVRRLGCEVTVAAMRGIAPYRLARPPAAGLRATILAQHWHQPPRCLRLLRHAPQAQALVQLARRTNATHLLAQFAWTPADITSLAARALRLPFSVRVHAWDVFVQRPKSLRQCLDSATKVLPCSRMAAEAVLACGISESRVETIYHGLPLHDPEWSWAPPPHREQIVGIGRLVPKKGVDLLLEACARLVAAGRTDFEAQWIGEGSERPRVERRRDALGLQGRFTFAGALPPEETRDRLRQAGLLALPSRRMSDGDRDGIANVLLEAMALGVPVITTTAGAAGEIIENGVNGLLIAPDNVSALEAALNDAMWQSPDSATAASAEAQRLAWSRVARATVEREFDARRNAEKLLRALRDSSTEYQ